MVYLQLLDGCPDGLLGLFDQLEPHAPAVALRLGFARIHKQDQILEDVQAHL